MVSVQLRNTGDGLWSTMTLPTSVQVAQTIAGAARQLNETQPVAVRVQPHRLGVDRDGVAEHEPLGQVAAMQLVSQTSIRSFKLTGSDYLPRRPARQFGQPGAAAAEDRLLGRA